MAESEILSSPGPPEGEPNGLHLVSVVKTTRRMLRLRPIPMASVAMSTSKPLPGVLNRRACSRRVSAGRAPYTFVQGGRGGGSEEGDQRVEQLGLLLMGLGGEGTVAHPVPIGGGYSEGGRTLAPGDEADPPAVAITTWFPLALSTAHSPHMPCGSSSSRSPSCSGRCPAW